MKKIISIITLISILVSNSMMVFAENNESELNSFLGTYRGSYYANQGHTGLTLKVFLDKNNNYKGEFNFYSVPENPSVPSGQYLCDVKYDNHNNSYYVEGVEWLSKPFGYEFVDLNGKYQNSIYKGEVISSINIRTYNFNLTKQQGNYEPSDWAEILVNDAILNGVVPLELQKDYKKSITRSEFTRLVVAAVTLQTGDSIETILDDSGVSINTNEFEDTKDQFVLAANALGIVKGYGNQNFGPNDKITREQSALMLRNTANKLKTFNANGTPITFLDKGTFSSWSKDSIDFITASIDPKSNTPIMTGYNNQFNPRGNYTNEQAFMTISKLINFTSK